MYEQAIEPWHDVAYAKRLIATGTAMLVAGLVFWLIWSRI